MSCTERKEGDFVPYLPWKAKYLKEDIGKDVNVDKGDNGWGFGDLIFGLKFVA